MNTNLSEQELMRREALHKISALGVNPYPAAEYEVNTSAAAIIAGYDANRTFRAGSSKYFIC